MCGRFTLGVEPDSLFEYFQLHGEVPAYRLSWNITPSQHVPIIVTDTEQGRICLLMHWGLIPHWSKQPDPRYRMINARSETIAVKPAYRDAFRMSRCLVPTDGFYEWQQNGKNKQPYYIYMREHRCFAMAGIWSRWRSAEQCIDSFAIITTSANHLMQPVHERMPVILTRENFDTWLQPDGQDKNRLESLLVPYAGNDLALHPVATAVNKPVNDNIKLTKTIK